MTTRPNSVVTSIIAETAVLDDGNIISPAVLQIENEHITHVSSVLPKYKSSTTLDLGDAILFPGFVNAHCHLELTSIGPLQRSEFIPWIKNLVGRKKNLTDTVLAQGIRDGANQLLQSGVTTVFDHVSVDTPLSCYRDLPLTVALFGEVLGRTRERATNQYRDFLIAKKHAPVRLNITPHALYSLHPEALREILENESIPFSIHLNESREEKEYFENSSGALFEMLSTFGNPQPSFEKSAICGLAAEKFPPGDSLLVHCNYLTDEDLHILATWQKNCVVHCPGSFAFFGHDGFPLNKIRAAGVPIALGTDSLASNVSLNFLDEIHSFLKMFPDVSFKELLPMLTTNAARAIGLNDVGKIADGSVADVVGFRMTKNKSPLEILTSAQKADFVLQRGKVRV